MDEGERQRLLQQWCDLPRQARQQRLRDAFERLAKSTGTDSDEAFGDVQFKVSAQGFANVRTLADLSTKALEEGRIEDQEIATKMREGGDARESFIALWGVPFQRAMQEVISADLDGDEIAFRLWMVYDRMAEFYEEFLGKEGWSDDFAPLIGIYQQAQSALAVSTAPNELMPNPTLGEILQARKP